MIIRIRALIIISVVLCTASANSQTSPPPPPMAEHSYTPTSKTVHILYTCMDGARSVTVQYRQNSRGEITSLIRNSVFARQEVIEQVNSLLERFDLVTSVSAECHNNADYLFVDGMIGRSRSGMLDWSLNQARFLQVL